MSRACTDSGPPLRELAAIAVLALLAGCASQTPAPGSGGPAGMPTAGASPVPQALHSDFSAALAALQAGDAVAAELALERLVLEYPGFAGPHVNLAIIYMRDGREADADAALGAALAIEPAHAAANNQLGILRRRQGRFDDAEAAYRRALAADPDYALVHYNLGVLLDIYAGRPREALQHYERYQSLIIEPSREVAGWIVELRRRLGIAEEEAARVAREESR